MARLITFAEAQTRFANLATTGISIEDAIQEAVDSIYESGRWPGTTVETSIAANDFELDSTGNFYLLKFDEEIYDGMVGFRCEHRGYSIVDQSMLYRDGSPGGCLNIVDLGTIDDNNGSGQQIEIIAGGFTPTDAAEIDFSGTILNYAGNYLQNGEVFGRYWSESGTPQTGAEPPFQEGEIVLTVFDKKIPFAENYFAACGVTLGNFVYGYLIGSPNFFGSNPVSFDWSEAILSPPDTGALGYPLELRNVVYRTQRVYRMPCGFNPEMGPYWALMKKEPPQLTDNDYIPINSVRALKYAILAICYEYVNDDGRATTYWSLFERAMQSATRQTAGPKNYFVGVKNTMSVRPTQFQ
jgi:hypothetical protein